MVKTVIAGSGWNNGPGKLHLINISENDGQSSLSQVSEIETGLNPMWIAKHPSKPVIYVVDSSDGRIGKIRFYSLPAKSAREPALKLLGEVSSEGCGPCHLSIDQKGEFIFVCNYDSGNFVVKEILDDGQIDNAVIFNVFHQPKALPHGYVESRQGEPHPHHSVVSPTNKSLLVCDLGLNTISTYSMNLDPPTDKSKSNTNPYSLKKKGEISLPNGAGPRQVSFHPSNNNILFCVNELDSTLTILHYDEPNGNLSILKTVPAYTEPSQPHSPPFPFYTSFSHASHISAKENALFIANRGADTISFWNISNIVITTKENNNNNNNDETTNSNLADNSTNFEVKLETAKETLSGGRIPWFFDIKESQMIVSNQYSSSNSSPPQHPGNVSLFSFDEKGEMIKKASLDIHLCMCAIFI